MKKHFLLAGFAALMLAACNNKPASELTLSGLDPVKFQTEVNNAQTALYTLKNKAGMEVCITNFGGRIVSVMVPDKNGKMQDVVLGFDSIADYINVPSDFGASIGRYANRINQGRFVLDGDTIQLPQNNFGHCLHGGPKGWQYQVYEANLIDPTTLELTLISPDGDANFPGNVTAKVTYQLTDDNAIDIKYSATTDKKTIINMTNHSYFNLAGDPSKTSTDNIMYVNADYYTPVDSTFMTTGEIAPVKDTPMDFTTPKAVGKDINNYDFVQLKNGNGYDHNWVLSAAPDARGLRKAACAASAITCMSTSASTTIERRCASGIWASCSPNTSGVPARPPVSTADCGWTPPSRFRRRRDSWRCSLPAPRSASSSRPRPASGR